MRRREFITLLGGAAVAWPLATRAQQAERMRRIGVLAPGPSQGPDASRATLDGLVAGLRDLGYVEGQTIIIEREYGESNMDRLRQRAADLVRRQVDIIVALSTTAARPAKETTSRIPIVAFGMADPVADELVVSLARPGATSRARPFSGRSWSRSGCSCSARSYPSIRAWLSCGTRRLIAIARWPAWSGKPSRRRNRWECGFSSCPRATLRRSAMGCRH